MINTDKLEYAIKTNGLKVISPKDILVLLGVNNKSLAYNCIRSLLKKNKLFKIKNGKYATEIADERVLGIYEVSPSYLAFLSALNYHGLTDQVPIRPIFATTKKIKKTKSRFIIINKKSFFGYIKIGDIVVSDIEKTILDCLHLLRESGGIKEVAPAIKQAWSIIDKKKLYDYLLRLDSTAVTRRLGFIIEHYKLKIDYDLSKLTKTGFTLLDPALFRKKEYNKKWHIINNWRAEQ